MFEALRTAGHGFGGIEETSATFQRLAVSAIRRLVLVTPYLGRRRCTNGVGTLSKYAAERRSHTVAAAAAICRSFSGVPSIGVFAPPRLDGSSETFHAKIILKDEDEAYVGSANLTATSLGYSLEIGCHFAGVAAGRVSRIVDCNPARLCITRVMPRRICGIARILALPRGVSGPPVEH